MEAGGGHGVLQLDQADPGRPVQNHRAQAHQGAHLLRQPLQGQHPAGIHIHPAQCRGARALCPSVRGRSGRGRNGHPFPEGVRARHARWQLPHQPASGSAG